MNIDKILAILAIISWVAVTVYAGTLFVIVARQRGIKTALIRLFSIQMLWLVVVPLVFTFLSASLVFIMPQQVGVVISILSPNGIRDRPLESGLHWIVPLAESVVPYPIYWQTYTMSSKPMEGQVLGDDAIVARTADGQEVSLDCSVIFRIDPQQANRVYIGWQNRYVEDLVRPYVRGLVRLLVSQYTVDEVNSDKRMDLEASLDETIRLSLEDKGFIFDQFLLRNIDFSAEYRESVEEKQVALQQATQREHQANQIRKLAAGQADQIRILAEGDADAIKIRAQAEAEARVIKAKAEAEALNRIGEALRQRPDLLTYQYIDKLSPAIRAMLVPSETPFILPLPTMEMVDTQTMTTTEEYSHTLPLSDIPITTPEPVETLLFTPTPTPTVTATPTATTQASQ